MRVHLLSSPIMTSLGYSSKLNAEWAFLTMLKEEGRRTVEKFLKNHGTDLGQRSTLNLNLLLEQV
jgi:NTE family protein